MPIGPVVKEQDFSSYVRGISTTSCGIVGTATKGEIGVPVLCTSQLDFYNKFGNTNPNCLGVYAGNYYLREGNKLWYVRLASDNAVESTVSVKAVLDTTEVADGLKLKSATKGTYYDGYKVVISNVDSSNCTFNISIKDAKSNTVEFYKNVNLDATSDNYVVKVLADSELKVESVSDAVTKNHVLVEGEYTFAGGNDGVTGVTSADYATAVEKLASSNYSPDIISTPGISDAGCIVSCLQSAESCGALYLVDPPQGLTVQQVADWHNGKGTYVDHAPFNSSYGALYYSWQVIHDNVVDQDVVVPPSVVVAPTIAKSDLDAEVWYAPAGLTRGLIKNAIKSETVVDDAQRDFLYEDGNVVNCIITHPTAGLAIFGNRTLQRTDTATDRINVRRLLNYLRKVVDSACEYLVFEPNDETTWNAFEDLIEPTLQGIKAKRGLYDYKVIMDENTVTDGDIDNYCMPGTLYIKPTKAAEYIPISFKITSTGADFSEL